MRRFSLFVIVAVAAAVFFSAGPAVSGDRALTEKWFTERWCALADGTMWVRMNDGGRCDCETSTHAVEVAFAARWADALGWSLRAAAATGKKPGIVLIEESAADAVHRQRLDDVIDRFGLPVRVWSTSRGVSSR